MTPRQIIIVILILSFWTTVSAKDFTLADLKMKESLEIRFQSRGCFHSTQIRIKILRTSGYFVEISENIESDPIVVTLSPDDIAQLDRLIAYYRSLERPGTCTTKDTVTLLWQGPRIKAFIEPFVDATCDAPEAGRMVIQRLMKQRG